MRNPPSHFFFNIELRNVFIPPTAWLPLSADTAAGRSKKRKISWKKTAEDGPAGPKGPPKKTTAN